MPPKKHTFPNTHNEQRDEEWAGGAASKLGFIVCSILLLGILGLVVIALEIVPP